MSDHELIVATLWVALGANGSAVWAKANSETSTAWRWFYAVESIVCNVGSVLVLGWLAYLWQARR